MFANLEPTSMQVLNELKNKRVDTFNLLEFSSKMVIYPEHLAVIHKLIKDIDKPVYQSVAKSLECLETLDQHIKEYEDEVINE